jgi:hypothetical protein
VILRSETPSFYDIHVRALIDNYIRRRRRQQQKKNVSSATLKTSNNITTEFYPNLFIQIYFVHTVHVYSLNMTQKGSEPLRVVMFKGKLYITMLCILLVLSCVIMRPLPRVRLRRVFRLA